LANAVSEKREALALVMVDVLAGVVVLGSLSSFFRFLLPPAKAVADLAWTAAASWRKDDMEPGV
jgi:hypothetical protein